MIYLILAILSSAMVSIGMRFSEGKVKHNFGMLVMNYCMCTLLAFLFSGTKGFSGVSGLTAVMGSINGVIYLTSFVLLQVNVRRNGVVLSSTFMKLGLLVTMAVSVFFYGEIPSLLQTVGFALAVGAIVLINYRKDGSRADFKLGLIWLLLCGGMADAMSKIFEESGPAGQGDPFFLFTFLTALLLCIGCMVRSKQRIGRQEIFFGLLVGIPNYLSSRLLLGALEAISAVIVYPVYSVACILVVSVTGVLVFRERLEKRQWAALGIIMAALVLLNI